MIRITDLVYTDEQITADIKRGCSIESPFFEMLTAIRLADVRGGDDYERGIIEGMRRMATEIQDRAMSKVDNLQVKTVTRE